MNGSHPDQVAFASYIPISSEGMQSCVRLETNPTSDLKCLSLKSLWCLKQSVTLDEKHTTRVHVSEDKVSQLCPRAAFYVYCLANVCELCTDVVLSIPLLSPPKASLISSVHQLWPFYHFLCQRKI